MAHCRPDARGSELDAELRSELDRIERAGLRRRLTPIESATDAEVDVDGERFVLMSSNNYLGLASHPA
jgi:7-keto-8-aminopelargonate synthetase-like enzyme